jgi:hypothetical protein
LILLAPLLSFAASNVRGSNIRKAEPLPCDADFQLRVIVNAVEGDSTEPLGFTLDYKKSAGRGIASRLQTGDQNAFSQATCQKWQKAQWDRLDHLLYTGKLATRSKLTCMNIATIEYRAPAGAKFARLCLGDARYDYTTWAFKKFYNGGDFLIEK